MFKNIVWTNMEKIFADRSGNRQLWDQSSAVGPVHPTCWVHNSWASLYLKRQQHGTRSGETGVGGNGDAQVRRQKENIRVHKEKGLRCYPKPPFEQGKFVTCLSEFFPSVFVSLSTRFWQASCCVHGNWETCMLCLEKQRIKCLAAQKKRKKKSQWMFGLIYL